MAIQAYDRCRAVLADLLDAAPSQETQRLLAEIRGPYGSRVPVRAAPHQPALQTPRRPRRCSRTIWRTTSQCRCWSRGHEYPRRPWRRACRRAAAAVPRRDRRGGASRPRTGRGNHHRAVAVPLDVRRRLQFARPLCYRDARRGMRSAAPSASTSWWTARSSASRNRLRITVRLLDLRAGNQVVWARRFDRQTNDLLTLQDEIAAEVVAQIDPEILLIEARRSASRPPVDATAYDLVLRAIPLIGRLERGTIHAGRRASRTGPSSWSRTTPPPMPGTPTGTRSWWARAGRRSRARSWSSAGQLAERAIVLDPFDARALTIAGHVRAYPASPAARGDRPARARVVAQSEPGDGLGAVGLRLRLSGRPG